MGPFTDGWTEADAEAVLARGEPDELLYVPIVAGMNADRCRPGWAERVCLELARHPNAKVRGNAILGLGHVARTCRKLDIEQAVPLISAALADPSEYVRGQAVAAADDVSIYLHVVVPEPESP